MFGWLKDKSSTFRKFLTFKSNIRTSVIRADDIAELGGLSNSLSELRFLARPAILIPRYNLKALVSKHYVLAESASMQLSKVNIFWCTAFFLQAIFFTIKL